MKRHLFICACNETKHQLIISYFEDEKFKIDREVYAEFHLVKLPFKQRLFNGIKYIFGFNSKFGDFDEFIFNSNDADKLQEVVNFLKKIK